MHPLLVEQEFKSLKTNVANHEQAIGSVQCDVAALKTSNNALVQRFSELHSTVVSLQVDKASTSEKRPRDTLQCPRCQGTNTTKLFISDDTQDPVQRIEVSTRWCNYCGDSYEPTVL